MNRLFAGCILILLILNSGLQAQSDKLGIGVIIGEPTGLSGKYWIAEDKAVDFAIGFSTFDDRNRMSLHADYLYHLAGVIPSNDAIPFYYGFGIRLRTHSREEGSLGVRGVCGLLVNLREMPVELFFEAAPVFQLLPDTKLKLDAALGGRYYFQFK